MSAHGFIEEIFSRPQAGMASNERCITDRQLAKLRALIGEDEDGGALVQKRDGGFEWKPRGRWLYIYTQRPNGTWRRLERRNFGRPTESGRLF